ncbi:MAG: M4 family metallopeptidase, partial [Acidobacteria bacterium]|nr:M4 family metallopeptidase [Acidobacteriota bacterium]
GKTTASVPALGITQAEKIFYRAQTQYLTSSSNFSAARTATSQAATDLYGATAATAVETAWCAVGVGSCPGSGGGGTNPCPTCETYTGSLSGTGAAQVQPN